MGKKTMNSAGSANKKAPAKKDSKALAGLAEQVIFTPTPRQAKVKAQFWSRFQPGPFASPSSLTLPAIQEVVNVPSMKEWWHLDGFQAWFLNREEAREKLEYLFMKALETAEDILDNPEAQASAKVNMIKVIGELANKFPSRWQEKFADEDINRMSEAQLKAYLEKQGVIIQEERVLEIDSEKETQIEIKGNSSTRDSGRKEAEASGSSEGEES